MSVVIIDYGSGHLRSVEKAVEHAVADRGLGMSVKVTSHAEDVAEADHIILPGVGAFGDCIRGLHNLDGMVESLEQAVLQQGKPFLGICVGMQLLASEGHEHGVHKGLGWIEGTIEPLNFAGEQGLKIPHMGWNEVTVCENHKSHPVLEGIFDTDHVYFVHSYHYAVTNPEYVMLDTDYGGAITSMIGRDNILGTQFHPEKSQQVGLRMIGNFMQWRP